MNEQRTSLDRKEKRVASELRGDWDIDRTDEEVIFGHLSRRFNTSDMKDRINQIVSSYINSNFNIFIKFRRGEEEEWEEALVSTTFHNEKIYLDVPCERSPVAPKSYRSHEDLVVRIDDFIERFAEERGLFNGAVLREMSEGDLDPAWTEGLDEYLWDGMGHEYSSMYLSFLKRRLGKCVEMHKVSEESSGGDEET